MAARRRADEPMDVFHDVKEEYQSPGAAAVPALATWRWPSHGGSDAAESLRAPAQTTSSWSWASAASEPVAGTAPRQSVSPASQRPFAERRRLHVHRTDAVAAAAHQPLEGPQQQQWYGSSNPDTIGGAAEPDRQPNVRRSQHPPPAAPSRSKQPILQKRTAAKAASAAAAANQYAQQAWGSADSAGLPDAGGSPMRPSHAHDAWHWPEDDTDDGADEHAAAMKANAAAAAAARANAAAAAGALHSGRAGTGIRRAVATERAATAARRATPAGRVSPATVSSSTGSGLAPQQRQQPHQQQQQQQQQQQRRVHFEGDAEHPATRHRTPPAQLPSPREPKRPRTLGAAAGTSQPGQNHAARLSQPHVLQPRPPPQSAAAAAAAAGTAGAAPAAAPAGGHRALQAAAWLAAGAAALGGPLLADVGGAAQATYAETIVPIGGALWSAADVVGALVQRALLPLAGLVLLLAWRLVGAVLRWLLRLVRRPPGPAEAPVMLVPEVGVQQSRRGWLWGRRAVGQGLGGASMVLPELGLASSRRRGWLWGKGSGKYEPGSAGALVAAGRKALAVLPCYEFEELRAATDGFGATALLPVGSGYGFPSAMTVATATAAAAGPAAATRAASVAGGAAEAAGPGALALRVPVYMARDVQGMPVAVAAVAVGDEQRLRRFCALANTLSQLRHPSLLLFMGASVGLAAPRAAYPMVVQRQQGQQEQQQQDAAVGCLVFELLPGVRTLEAALAPVSISSTAEQGTAAASGTSTAAAGRTAQAAAPMSARATVTAGQARAAAAAAAAAGVGPALAPAALDSAPPLPFAARLQLASTLASTLHHLLVRGAAIRPGASALADAVLVSRTGQAKVNAAALLLLPGAALQSGSGTRAGTAASANEARLVAEAAAVSALGHVLLLLLTGPPLAVEPDVSLLREVLSKGQAAGLTRQPQPRSTFAGANGGDGGSAHPNASAPAAASAAPGYQEGVSEELAAGLLEAALLCLSAGDAADARSSTAAWLPSWLRWRRRSRAVQTANKQTPLPWGQLLSSLADLAERAAAPAAAAGSHRAGSPVPPAMFVCPLTHDVMADPVVAADGFVYERSAIQRWLGAGHRRSPMTNVGMAAALVPNYSLRSAIMDWRQQQQQQQ